MLWGEAVYDSPLDKGEGHTYTEVRRRRRRRRSSRSNHLIQSIDLIPLSRIYLFPLPPSIPPSPSLHDDDDRRIGMR